jgi:hypothetical protein
MTIDESGEEIRKLYPDAVSVKVFVTKRETRFCISRRYRDPGIASWKMLNGEWSPTKEEALASDEKENPSC